MAAITETTGKALTLTTAERAKLLSLLEQVMREKKVEEHRTDSLEFKEFVRREEAVFQGLIDKLR